MNYYVPGDRVWFKNPDERFSNASGYEGSWVIYLGGGKFSNFWKRDAPYTLNNKLMEVYHWRHGVSLDDTCIMQMDEELVEDKVAATRADPVKKQKVLKRMARYRDPMGVYSEGGCIDASR
jgi:Protein-glutamine gamma-glutamyltransferase